MSQRVLITGANGRLGKLLAKHLVSQGHAVRGLVRSNPKGEAQSTAANPSELGELLRHTDTLLHLASTSSKDPATQQAVHVELTQQLLEAANAAGVANIVYFSSVKAVAGEHCDQAIGIDRVPEPNSDYGRFKLAAERVLFSYHFSGDTKVEIVRLPMVYGPSCGGNFDRLAGLVKRGLPIPLARDNARSLLFAGNLCGYVDALLGGPTLAFDRPRLSHLADPQPLSSLALTAMIARAQGGRNASLGLPQWLARATFRAPLVGGYAARLFGSLELDTTSLNGWTAPFTTEQGVATALERPQAGG